LESACIVRYSKSPWAFLLAHGSQKRWILATLWQLSLSQFGDNRRQVPFAKHAGPIHATACMVATFFQKITLLRVITKSLLQP
jgi:hypothetical protein